MVDGQEQPTNLSGESAAFFAATADVPDTLGEPGPQPVDAGELGTAQPVVGGLTVEALEMTFGMAFGMIGARIGEEGKFWELQDLEKRQLALAWHPILSPLWAKWMADTDGAIVAAVLCTAMTVAPRLMQDSARRASLTASTATGKSGDSSLSQGLPVLVNPLKPIA
jgi:hypothetical protein